MGMEVMVLVFIVIIIGGLGSVGGCFVGSLLVALVANYVGFLAPKLALDLQHPCHGARSDLAPAGPVSGGAPMSRLTARQSPRAARAASRTAFSRRDTPRSRVLSAILIAIVRRCSPSTPFLFSGSQPLSTAAKICIFIVLVASYDLLLGYTGIVSFAHTMFFGIGGYGVGYRA